MTTRRDFLRRAAVCSLGLPLIGSEFYQHVTAATVLTSPSTPKKLGKAKSVIQIWMWGGPSHLDTFDPKPGAGRDYCGSWDKPLTTNVPRMAISQSLPELAKCADIYSLLRSVTHETNNHETAAYRMQTGRMPGGGLVFPCIGAIVSLMKGYDAGYDLSIPPYFVMTTAQGRFSECGFLGSKYKPFVTGGDPSRDPFLVSGYVVEGITKERNLRRQNLLRTMDTFGHVASGNAVIDEIDVARENANQLMLGDAVRIFDLTKEPTNVREGYGKTWIGQACMMARRLVQAGVPYITINYNKGWDTHKRHFESLTRLQPEWDKGVAMLLKELAQLGLLDNTIVWWGGEFGRTPKVDWNSPWMGGRGHYSKCFSSMIAGGGFRGGQIVGESDARGENVVTRPIAPQDILASILLQMGIDPAAQMPAKGFDVPMMAPVSEQGILHELVG